MKSVNHVYEIAISEEVRKTAVHNVRKNARKTRGPKYGSEDEVVRLSKGWIESYENAEHKPIEIYDGISRKKRTIIVPTTRELVVQHCVVEALKPMFFRGMYRHSYASIPRRSVDNGNGRYIQDIRGAHNAKKFIVRWLKSDRKNTKYVLKMDIKRFFESVPHDRLKAMLAKSIHDKRMTELLFKIIDVVPQGLPLGFYLSQWLSNWYLQGLDHYIKEELGAKYYVRYMDDMVIFGSNKRKLHKIRAAIDGYLRKRLGLELKGNWQVFRFAYVKDGRQYGRDLDFMGFRFFRNRTVLRRSIMLKGARKAKKIAKKDKPTVYDARQMLSYGGWLRHSDTYDMYRKRIKPFVNFGKLKKTVSKHDRRRSDEMAESMRNTGRKTA